MGPASSRAEALPWHPTEALGSRAKHRLALSEQEDEQGLRAVMRDDPGHDLRRYESPDAEETRPCLTLLAQLLASIIQVGLALFFKQTEV
jgi:hypothetical protein